MNKMLCRPLHRGISRRDTLAIQRLFSDGALGGYWPADPAYLYEDSAGTIPASMNGVVGLRFDLSKGLDKDLYDLYSVGGLSGYAGRSSISVSGDTVTVSCVSSNGNFGVYISSSAIIGSAYRYSFVVNNTTGKSLYLYNENIGQYGLSMPRLVNTHGTSILLLMMASGVIGDSFQVSGVMFKHIKGNHALQATTANKPYLRRTPVSNKYWLDSNTSTGALTATFASSLGSACTIATVGAEGVTIAENQTVSTTYNLTPPYGYNGDVLIINRALTAVEKALVTRVLGRKYRHS